MGEKKQKETTKNFYKILAILGCVLFVVLMVVSSMGSNWVNYFSAIKPGDSVTIDYTIRDNHGTPLVTTDKQLYAKVVGAGYTIFFGKQLVLQANQSTTKAVIPIPVYTTDTGWSNSFALLGVEYNTISSGIIGMKQNEQKTIIIPFNDSMAQVLSADQLKQSKVNLTEVQVGDKYPMGVSETPVNMTNTTPQASYIRVGEIIKKTSDYAVVNYANPKIDIQIASITQH
ncbi:MAG: hypothetical protein ABR887_03020 [Methanoregulaceae archaeon]|jgi:hypothetical protein